MSLATELHVQAALWQENGWRFAALFLEGEAPDRTENGVLVDAVFAVTRARGLALVTDPEPMSLRPVPGWRLRVEPEATVTLEWPHQTPLLDTVPLTLPPGWLEAVDEHGIALVLAGSGLGMHEHAHDGQAHAGARLNEVAREGALVGGAVPVSGRGETPVAPSGTVGRPHRNGQHRSAAPTARSASHRRWWAGHLHRHHHHHHHHHQ